MAEAEGTVSVAVAAEGAGVAGREGPRPEVLTSKLTEFVAHLLHSITCIVCRGGVVELSKGLTTHTPDISMLLYYKESSTY